MRSSRLLKRMKDKAHPVDQSPTNSTSIWNSLEVHEERLEVYRTQKDQSRYVPTVEIGLKEKKPCKIKTAVPEVIAAIPSSVPAVPTPGGGGGLGLGGYDRGLKRPAPW
ncbi:hypothetical protein RB195_013593 [Necator americanus]|uniref:Uncharacterized protein n=1 Tax=Necator americanus TaxID=51031 RepID=A0ABR1DWC1_NECAM